MNCHAFQVILLAAVLTAFARFARAQTTYSDDSVEWSTASADLVVKASIAEAKLVDQPPPKYGDPREWIIVTLKVESVLKGGAPEKVQVVYDYFKRPTSVFSSWKESGEPLLWFLAKHDAETIKQLPPGYPPEAEAFRQPELPIVLVPANGKRKLDPPHLSMDLRLLEDEKAILDAVKAEAARDQGQRLTQWVQITLPPFLATAIRRLAVGNTLYLPVNAELERLARLWIKSPQDFLKLPPEWIPDPTDHKREESRLQDNLREDAVKSLRNFKSDANIALLKPLLADTTIRNENRPDGQFRAYYIRRAAYDVLTDWGTKVDKPVLEEPAKP